MRAYLRCLPVAFLLAVAGHPAQGQDALRGKLLYNDLGRVLGTGVSCVDCHGGIPGALHGLEGRAANNPSGIAYAIGAIPQMARLRGRLSGIDMADIAAFVGRPEVPSPQVRLQTAGRAASPYNTERLEFEFGDRTPSTVWVTNAGALPVRLLEAPDLAGPDAREFTLESNCEAGRILPPGESCAIRVAFLPTLANGLRTAVLRIPHDWIGGGANVALLGRAAREP